MESSQTAKLSGIRYRIPQYQAGISLKTRLILRYTENKPVRIRLFGGERGIRTLDTGLIRITP